MHRHAPRALLLVIALLIAGYAPPTRAAEPLAKLKPKIDALVAPLLDNQAIVGLVVGIRRGDEELFLPYGKIEVGQEAPPTPETVYEIGSISKAFTGVLLADASLRNQLNLDATVAESLPPGAPQPAASEHPITLSNLSTHTSGLPRLPYNLKATDPANPYANFTAADAYDFFAKFKPSRKPGKYEYSNFAVGLLGQLLADRAGKSYEELMLERICEPLGMAETRITLTPPLTARLAPPYNADLQRVKNWDFQAFAGAGGIRSTPRDMLKFAAAMLANDDREVTQAFHLSGESRETIPGDQSIGLGWHIARDQDTRWHNGQTGGYSSYAASLPKHDVAVALLCNTSTDLTTILGERIAQTALGMDVPPPDVRKVVDVPLETLKKYVGVYSLNFFFAITITLEEGRLMARVTLQDAAPIYPSSETEFFYRIVDAQIKFVTDDKGEVTKLILHQNGVDHEAPRNQ